MLGGALNVGGGGALSSIHLLLSSLLSPQGGAREHGVNTPTGEQCFSKHVARNSSRTWKLVRNVITPQLNRLLGAGTQESALTSSPGGFLGTLKLEMSALTYQGFLRASISSQGGYLGS